jgi:hypothetical protein
MNKYGKDYRAFMNFVYLGSCKTLEESLKWKKFVSVFSALIKKKLI